MGAWILALLVGSVNAACNAYRPEPDFSPPTLSEPVTIVGTPLTQIWSRHSVRGPSGPLAIDSLCIYVAGSDHRLTAVDLATGANRWVVRLSGPVTAGVLRVGDLLYAATDQPGGEVHAVKPSSGNKAWTTGTGYVDVPLRLIDGQLLGAQSRRRPVVARSRNRPRPLAPGGGALPDPAGGGRFRAPAGRDNGLALPGGPKERIHHGAGTRAGRAGLGLDRARAGGPRRHGRLGDCGGGSHHPSHQLAPPGRCPDPGHSGHPGGHTLRCHSNRHHLPGPAGR